jgi:hypothetical protein
MMASFTPALHCCARLFNSEPFARSRKFQLGFSRRWAMKRNISPISSILHPHVRILLS